MINLEVITIILNIISIVFAFIGGFFFGRAYEIRSFNKQLQSVLDDLRNIKKRHLRGGEKHG